MPKKKEFRGTVINRAIGAGVRTTLFAGFKAMRTSVFPVQVNLIHVSELDAAKAAVEGAKGYVIVFDEVTQYTPPVILRWIAEVLEQNPVSYALCDDWKCIDMMRSA